MSAYKAVQLLCDASGCRRFKTVRVTATASGIHEARERAAAIGWTFTSAATDLCPVHSA